MLAVCDILAIAQHADGQTLGDGHMQIDEPGVLAVAVVEGQLAILGDFASFRILEVLRNGSAIGIVAFIDNLHLVEVADAERLLLFVDALIHNLPHGSLADVEAQ